MKKKENIKSTRYWHLLASKTFQYYLNMVSQARAKDVLSIVKNSADNRECENELVLNLGNNCFDLYIVFLITIITFTFNFFSVAILKNYHFD